MAVSIRNFAEFLKERRLQAGLSQADVAEKFGYSTPQYVSNWERGVSVPPISSLKKLALLYKVSAEELFEEMVRGKVEEVTADLKRRFRDG